ncbi:MAG: hypothetical protein R2761_17565 [Acidimicrobiales bacterium]
MADDRPLERDDSVGQFPGEFGVPVSIPQAQIVYDDLAFAFDQFLVFDVGFFVTLRVLHRSPRVDSHYSDLVESFFGGPDRMAYSKRFRWGIQLADGRRGYGMPMQQSDADFAIGGRGGGGDSVMSEYRFWVHASPMAEMTFFVGWPARGLAERSLLIDSSALVEASTVDTRIASW